MGADGTHHGVEASRADDFRQGVLAMIVGVQVHRDDQVAVAGHHRHDRQRVEDAAVDQHAVALHDRCEQARNGRRGAHGLFQVAFLEPDFLLVGQVGGHGGEGNWQVFDVDIAEHVADAPEDLLPADGAQAEAGVDQPQHVQIIQALDPFAVFRQLARRVDAAHHGAHRTAGDTVDFVAPCGEFFDDADVRIAPRPTRAQYQGDCLAHAFLPVGDGS